MLRRLLQMQGGNSLGLGKKLAGSLGWSLSCSISSSLEPLQLPWLLLGWLTVLRRWQSRVRGSQVPEARRGDPAIERSSCRRRQQHGEGQGKAGQGSSPEAGLPCWRRVGLGRVRQQGEIRDLFIQLAFAFKFLLSTYIFTVASQGSLLLLYFNK